MKSFSMLIGIAAVALVAGTAGIVAAQSQGTGQPGATTSTSPGMSGQPSAAPAPAGQYQPGARPMETDNPPKFPPQGQSGSGYPQADQPSGSASGALQPKTSPEPSGS